MRQKREPYDVSVVGAGVAGLSAALAAADAGASVLVLAKASHTSSNSYAAQGGIAAAVGSDDDPALHVADTLAAGRGLCRQSAVELLAAAAPAEIEDLRHLGVRFDEGLGREGGKRIRSGDHCDLAANQVGGQLRQAVILILGEAIFDRDVLTLDKA